MIGVVDWGVGGLGVARQWRAGGLASTIRRPAMLYLSDTGAPPYGTLDRHALGARLRQVIAFLRGEGADAIMLACNAASTALGELTDLGDVRGVVAPTLAHVLKGPRPSSLAILGGARTIRSRVYATALRAHRIAIVQRVAQPLSAMIERGEHQSAAFEHAARALLTGTSQCDALLLACTHYPAALTVFDRLFAGRIIDPLAAIARAWAGAMPSEAMGERAADAFFTTGDPSAMKRAAVNAWGAEFLPIEPRNVGL